MRGRSVFSPRVCEGEANYFESLCQGGKSLLGYVSRGQFTLRACISWQEISRMWHVSEKNVSVIKNDIANT